VARRVLQLLVQLFTLDGGGDLGGNKLQQRLVFFGVMGVPGMTSQRQRADRALVGIERDTEPARALCTDERPQVLGQGTPDFGRQQQRLAGSNHFFAQGGGRLQQRGRLVILVDVIRETQLVVLLVAQRDGKIMRRQQL